MSLTEEEKAAFDAIRSGAVAPPVQEVETPIEPEVQAEADMEIAQSGPSAMQQIQGLGIEMGGTIGGTYATTKALQTQKVAKGLSLLKNIRRAGQTVAAAGTLGPQAAEPVSTIGGLVTLGVTEAVWAAGSNFVKQEYFKALGVQEETSGGELLASALLVGPLISQGRKIPKIGQVFDTAMINSRKWRVGAHMVQGSLIGSVESSIRQTFDLMADEDATIGDFSMTDLFTGAAGGAAFGGALGLGSDAIGLVKTYRAVVARSKVEMRGSLVERLAKLDKTIAKAQKMGANRNRIVAEMHAAKVKKELDQLDSVHDSIDEKLSETEAALESVNTPKEAPEASATTATSKNAPEVTPAPKTSLEALDAEYLKAVENGDLEKASSIIKKAAELSGYSNQGYHGSPDFKGNSFSKEYLGKTSGLGRGGFSFTQDIKAAKSYLKSEIDENEAIVDTVNNKLDSYIKSNDFKNIEINGVDLEDIEFDVANIDDILEFKSFVKEIAEELPEAYKDDLLQALNVENETSNPRLIEAFLKDPESIDVDGKELFLIKDSKNVKLSDTIVRDDNGNIIPPSRRFDDGVDFRGEAPEATPAPKTPEVVPEAAPKTPFQSLMDDYDSAIAEQSQGRGADQIVALNKHFNAISDDFAKKADALIANPDAESVDDLLAMLDEYTAFDAKDAELKQKTGQELRAQGRDAGDADFEREKMSPERQIRNDALKEVREKLQAMKEDVDGAEMQKLVDDIFTYPEPVKGKSTRTPSPDEAFMPPPKDGEAPVVTPKDPETPTGETKAPKKTPKERSIARLQKKLDELRAIRSGEQDPKAPKPKKAKSVEEKDLEDRIKFYQGESKEVDAIAASQERIQVLSGLIQGNSPSQIRQQIGLPPKFLPSHAKPKKIESHLTKLKAQEAKLMKILRRKQTDAILSNMRDVFDPANGSRSIVDTALNGYLMARTDALLNQPSTATTGLPSGALRVIWAPIKATGINTVQALNPADRSLKGVPMTQRMKFAAADMLATYDQLITFAQSPIVTAKQALRNTVDTFKQGGSSGYFYKDANKIDMRDDAVNAGNSSIRNTRNVIQADIRAKANDQKNVIVKQAMKLMGSDPATAMMALSKTIWSAGRSGVGALDEPFNLVLQGRSVRAEAIKEAIKQKVKPEEITGFIDDYITKSSTVDAQGVKRFNYLDEKYKNLANQTRRDLFRTADLEKGDPRILMEEHLVNFFRSAAGGDLTAGKFLFRFLNPIISTPTVALAQQGRTLAQSTGVPALIDVGQRVYAGGAKRVGEKGKISNVMSGGVNKQINDLEMKVEDLRSKTKEKGLDPEEQTKRDENLAANKEKLKSLRDYRDEQTYEKIAMAALGMGVAYTFFELGKNGSATGAGAFLTRDQRNQGEFQKYRMLADEDSEGFSYLLFEPLRFLAAFSADLGAWSALDGSTTEKQTIGNFVTSTLEAYATDAVFTTNLRHMKDLAFGKEKSRTGAVIDIAAGAIPVPSAVRSARVLDDENYSVYDEGAGAGDILSRAFDKAVGTEAENFRVDKLGRPLLRPERGALHYVFRYAPEDRAHRMTAEEEVRQVLRNDGLSYNLIPKLTEFKTINGTQVNLKEFTRKDRSLFNLFAEVVNDGDEMLHELHDLVTDEGWQADYDNYTVEPNPDNRDELYNRGIDRFKEVRQNHIDRAVDYISDESNINLFRNKDGQTVHEYIQSLEERPAKSGNVLEKLNQF